MAASIVVVDDDAGVRRALRDVLEKDGYQVREAPNGRLAMQEVRRERADILITDIFMPEQEGVETIGAARRAYPDLKIIAISGAAGAGYLEVARLMGAHATLSKPFLPSQVRETVRTILAG
jgi:DNA-binding NtrC family response regulator